MIKRSKGSIKSLCVKITIVFITKKTFFCKQILWQRESDTFILALYYNPLLRKSLHWYLVDISFTHILSLWQIVISLLVKAYVLQSIDFLN